MKQMDVEEMKKNKAKKLRYKKPIVKNLNLETIQQDLWDIQESCEEVHWFTDSDDGSETLINALSGDEDEAYEFKMAFADLCAECERMFDDMQEEWVPDCFDILFVAAGAGETYGGLLGFDSYEQDYFGIGCSEAFAEDEAKKKLKQMINNIKEDSNVEKIVVFGSSVQDTCHMGSDVDFYIVLKQDQKITFKETLSFMYDIWTNYTVDSRMYEEITKKGVTVYERDIAG